ncbi:unnamed protein product [Caenorhabditis bovis]|uniref:C2H2-type domain-containing protein n=1 Tax=Caenorhabditis bovis TaxID=2654633 RepID=A0A8S1F1V9_9PELO|nr:unnamed protein product [Caenorhabditis bovis]
MEYGTMEYEEEHEEQEDLMMDDEDEEDDHFDEEMMLEGSDSPSSVVAVSPHGTSSNSSTSPSLQVESPSARTESSTTTSSGVVEKRHICDICGKAFSYFSILESHKRSHTGEKPFKCHFCVKTFAQKATLQVHERTHTGERPYKCRYCDKTFAQYGTKTVHEKSAHLGIRNYKCPKCGKLLSSPSALYTHKKTHGDKTFRCEFCPKTFALKNYLKLHVKQVHEQNEKKHVCRYCNRGFAYAGSLQVHVRTHTGERPYVCRFCPKAFASQGNLQSHERTHTGERPYTCQYCQRTFIQKSQLTAHEATHLGQKNSINADHEMAGTASNREETGTYRCSFCHVVFPFASNLFIHLRKHKDKLYGNYCKACGETYPVAEALNGHMEHCAAYQSLVKTGIIRPPQMTNEDSESDGEIRREFSSLGVRSFPPPVNIYQQPPPQHQMQFSHLRGLPQISLGSSQPVQQSGQLNFGLPVSQPPQVFPHAAAPVQPLHYPSLELPPTDFGPLTGSKPPSFQPDQLGSSEALSAFHPPVSKSQQPMNSTEILNSFLPQIPPTNSNPQLSLSTSLLSTQLLLQQLQNPDQLNYLLQQNLLSLAASLPQQPQFYQAPSTAPPVPSAPAALSVVSNPPMDLASSPIQVLASAERDFHDVWIEYDTVVANNKHEPRHALIFVALLNDQFTFGGLPEMFYKRTSCAAFHTDLNIVERCHDDYFLLRADLINLKKVIFDKDSKFDTVCVEAAKKANDKIESLYKDKYNYVMRYENRVLMMYKPSRDHEKCIGTYDMDEDVFTCVRHNGTDNVPVLEESFLFNKFDKSFNRVVNTVEVYCRVPHTSYN